MFLADSLINYGSLIRELAKSGYWQTIFSNIKENPFVLFENKNDFTELQLLFISYLNFFSTISTDVMTNEVPKLVWEKDIYQDCYIQYRSKKMYKEKEQYKNSPIPQPKKSKHEENLTTTDKWIFNKKRK